MSDAGIDNEAKYFEFKSCLSCYDPVLGDRLCDKPRYGPQRTQHTMFYQRQ